jgi:hypothetical protein
VNSRWCEVPSLARSSRQDLLRCAAENNSTVIPAHAKGVHGWRVGRAGDGFSIGFDVQTEKSGDELANS